MATMMDQAAEPQPRNDTVALDRQREQGEPAKGNSRKKVIIPIVAVLVLAALVWGVKEYLYARAHESTDNAEVDGHVIPVLAKVGGYITTLAVQENDSVKANQVLARIDDSEYKVKVAQAEADLAAARAAAPPAASVLSTAMPAGEVAKSVSFLTPGSARTLSVRSLPAFVWRAASPALRSPSFSLSSSLFFSGWPPWPPASWR